MLHRLTFGAASAALVFLVSGAPMPAQVRNTAASPVIVAPAFSDTLPVQAEHRYRMAAKFRPLLVFWVGRDNVGSARITWRRGSDGARGWELLIGSDPNRAPAHVNRWGYIREEGTDADASMLGVMKDSSENSPAEARAHVEQAQASYIFKLIRTRVADGQSQAVVTTGAFARDYTYRDLPALLGGFESPAATVGKPRQVLVGRNAKPGFLIAVADLIHDTTYAYHRSGTSGLSRRAVVFAYNGTLYDLTMAAPRVLKNARYGERTYPLLLQADFEVHNRTTGGNEQFSLVFGADGAIEEVPVFISYQPRWWFKAELLLDENQRF